MATLTINTTAPQDARLVVAFGNKLGLKDGSGNPRNATAGEIKQWIIDEVSAVVRNYEYEQAKVALTTPAFDPT